jgi:hypothetical protein
MATVTPNFNWPVPTSTDLVKDGATAIEALGDSIDASLLDLKGGTTGQVLSKTTNTDMDFTWVTTDDANAIQNSIVDAKGDLIAASAADTPARLAVGANDTMLVADSSTATGLAYKSAATLYPLTTYTPVVTQNGTITATISYAKYQQVGKLVTVQVRANLTSAGTAGHRLTLTLPIAATTANTNQCYGSFTFLDSGVAYYTGSVTLNSTTTTAFTVNNTNDFLGVNPSIAVASGDAISFTMIYEVA